MFVTTAGTVAFALNISMMIIGYSEIGILWNDQDLKIKWPIKNPIISKKDNQNFN